RELVEGHLVGFEGRRGLFDDAEDRPVEVEVEMEVRRGRKLSEELWYIIRSPRRAPFLDNNRAHGHPLLTRRRTRRSVPPPGSTPDPGPIRPRVPRWQARRAGAAQ